MFSVVRLVLRLCLLLICVKDAYQQAAYDDWSWVKNFAAIGDSYTAGIGVGSLLDNKCSRYDGSWAAMISRQLPSMENFYNLACSGAQTSGILSQIQSLPNNLDLAVMTAGGNDLCLAPVLLSCILSPFASVSACNEATALAQSGLDTYFTSNVQTLVQALDSKMSSTGVIVVLDYAEFFDSTTSACTNEVWSVISGTLPGTYGIPLTTDLRASLNDLVAQANSAISNAVENAQRTTSAKIAFADWNVWAPGIQGRFCEQGQYSNPAITGASCPSGGCGTEQLQFFKLDTTPFIPPYGIIDGRDEGYLKGNNTMPEDDSLARAWREAREDVTQRWNAVLEEKNSTTSNTKRLSARSLDLRDLITPACPATTGSSWIPDYLGKLFHPTLVGHTTMMTYAMEGARDARGLFLGQAPPGCEGKSSSCSNPATGGGYQPYASNFAVLNQVVPFCFEVDQIINSGSGGTLPTFTHTTQYYPGTPDFMQLQVQFTQGDADAFYWSRNDCIAQFQKLVSDCWANNDPTDNPLEYVFGSEITVTLKGSWSYEVTPLTTNRPWPLPARTTAEIDMKIGTGSLHTAFTFFGQGWASWDHGQTTLLPNLTHCFGKAPLEWGFSYTDPQSNNGFEWQALGVSPGSADIPCLTDEGVIYYSGGPTASNVVRKLTDTLPPASYSPVCDSGVDVSSLSCYADCCGYLPCPPWCNANCGGIVAGCK